MAATTRNKASARWAVLLVSGLASAGFLWGIVNAPGSADANNSTASNSAAVATPTPAASQPFVRRRVESDEDNGVGIASPIAPSGQAPTTAQSSQSSHPSVSTGRFRTRGS